MAEELNLEHFDLGTFVDYVHALKQERDALRAQLHSQGGEAVEVVAYMDENSCLWNGTTHPGRMTQLMTVAQHQRILAANAGSAEPVFMWHRGATEEESEVVDVDCACPCCVPLYTHPADQVEDDLTMVKVSRELLQDLRDLAFDQVEHHRAAMGAYKQTRQSAMDSVLAQADALLRT